MRQYKNYQIFINYNIFDESEQNNFIQSQMNVYDENLKNNPKLQEEIRKEREEYLRKTGNEPFDYRRHIAKYEAEQKLPKEKELEEIRKDNKLSETARKYEEAVVKQLDMIHNTLIGRCLLDFLNSEKKVWILPFFEEGTNTPKTFTGVTYHNDFFTKSGGGIRVHFYPWEKGTPKKSAYDTDDDILFHELVHVYRHGYQSYADQWNEIVDDYTDAEEFIALSLQNMYRNSLNRNLYKIYGSPQLVKPNEAEKYIFSKASLISLLDKAQKHDVFIRAIKKWKLPKFNPWRDFESLSRNFYGRDPYLNSKRMLPIKY